MKYLVAITAALLVSTAPAFAANAHDNSLLQAMRLAEQERDAKCDAVDQLDSDATQSSDANLPADTRPIVRAVRETNVISHCIVATRKYYHIRARLDRIEQTAFDSTVLTLITTAVSAAFFHGGEQLVGGLGLAAGGVSAYRSYYDPNREGHTFNKASTTLQCFVDESSLITLQTPFRLVVLRRNIQRLKYKVVSAFGNVPPPHDAKTTAEYTATAAAVTTAIDAADSVTVALTAEINAYLRQPNILRKNLSATNEFVTLQNDRAYVNANDVQQRINSGISAATAGAVSAAEARVKLQAAQSSAPAPDPTSKLLNAVVKTNLEAAVPKVDAAGGDTSSGQSPAPGAAPGETPAKPDATATAPAPGTAPAQPAATATAPAPGTQPSKTETPKTDTAQSVPTITAAASEDSKKAQQSIDDNVQKATLSPLILLLNELAMMANDEIADRPFTGVAAHIAGCTAGL